MIRNEAAKVVFFDTLIKNQRKEVLSWLRFKYSNISYADAEDIFQEASLELWKKLCNEGFEDKPMIGMLKAICRNVHGHWIHRQKWNEDWNDKFYPQDDGVETDYGYMTSETARMLRKEVLYDMIDHLAPKERALMEMYLKKIRMDEIARELGFRNAKVAKTCKCKIVVKLRKDVNAQAEDACASFF